MGLFTNEHESGDLLQGVAKHLLLNRLFTNEGVVG